MKIRSFKIIALLVLLFAASCNSQDPIIGTWERFGDIHSGMRIEVINGVISFKGIIVSATDSNSVHGFAVNDIKWKNIKKKEANKYEFENLGKTVTLPSDKFEPTYSLSYLELLSNDTIKTKLFERGTETVGTEQLWKRVSSK